MTDRRITVVGAGSWGTALADLLARNGHQVRLWTLHQQVADGIAATGKNPHYLTGTPLSERLTATTDLHEAVSFARDMLLWVVPSHATREVLQRAAPALGDSVPVVSATKGIEVDTLCLMTDILAELLGGDSARDRLAVLSGPSFAQEVADQMPTAVVASASNPAMSQVVQTLFANSHFRVYDNQDPIGTQIGGALKNVVALAAGACQGLQLGHNTQAVLITRGLAEITRLGLAMGANPATFAGLSGMGDLVLTCTGGLSRNRQVGIALGQGQTLEDILDAMNMVAEGVKTTAAAYQLANKHGIEMPLVTQIHHTLFDGLPPQQALKNLMGRPQRAESDPTGS